MIDRALFVRLTAKPGKEAEVEAFLKGALDAVEREHDTLTWYAVKFGEGDFAIFDTFPNEEGRSAHLSGAVGTALTTHGPDLLQVMPDIERAEVLAFKSGGDRAVEA